MNRLALFDCDGTLVDSQANIYRAMEEAFGQAGLDLPDRNAIRRIVGLSLVEAVATLIPDAEPDLHVHLAQCYRDRFIEMRRSGGMAAEPLYDGIAETIEALDATGWVLGVATGKSDRGLHLLLDHHGLKHRFVTLQTADRHPSKPHPSMVEMAMAEAGATPETTVMIGDTSYDMAMAVAARAHPLGVSWGYHAPEELVAAGAIHVLDHASAIPDYLERT
ncbi:HAD-IA family hydrolase [Sphingomonas sp. AX6]|uniref:HAD-IA family hydrolase n=1 Tax=Sphingomonas sp. AX6 TaxID=2653171 RepID=UPI0012F23E9A|nr:HAD-IA family hydrolase [Sphingomonas sp. AX6]VXD00618.1 putative phosphoglycolate phosphatase, clustered with ribosomal large subunit pseudouridine synthase C [Sphingomonas sp. AX6]